MGQIVIGADQEATPIQKLVMDLHRSDQEENVRRIEAAFNEWQGGGDPQMADPEVMMAGTLAQARKLAEDQQAHINRLEARIAELEAHLGEAHVTPPAPAIPTQLPAEGGPEANQDLPGDEGPDLDALNVQEAAEAIAKVNDADTIKALIRKERRSKDRKGVLDALEARKDEIKEEQKREK